MLIRLSHLVRFYLLCYFLFRFVPFLQFRSLHFARYPRGLLIPYLPYPLSTPLRLPYHPLAYITHHSYLLPILSYPPERFFPIRPNEIPLPFERAIGFGVGIYSLSDLGVRFSDLEVPFTTPRVYFSSSLLLAELADPFRVVYRPIRVVYRPLRLVS